MEGLPAEILAARAAARESRQEAEEAGAREQAAREQRQRAREREDDAVRMAQAAEARLTAHFGQRLLPALLKSPELILELLRLRASGFSLLLLLSEDALRHLGARIATNGDVVAMLCTCKQLATATSQIWETRRQRLGFLGRTVATLRWRGPEVAAFAVLEDGTLAVGGGTSIYLWRGDTLQGVLHHKNQGVCFTTGMVVLPGGYIATAGTSIEPLGTFSSESEDAEHLKPISGAVYIWKVSSAELFAIVPVGDANRVGSFAVVDGHLVSAHGTCIHVHRRVTEKSADRRNGKLRIRHRLGLVEWQHGHSTCPMEMVTLQDGSIVSTDRRSGARLWRQWRSNTNRTAPICAGHCPSNYSVEYGRPEYDYQLVALTDGSFATGSWHGMVKVWDSVGTCKHTHLMYEPRYGSYQEDRVCVGALLALLDGGLVAESNHFLKLFAKDGSVVWARDMPIYTMDHIYNMALLPSADQESAHCLMLLGSPNILQTLDADRGEPRVQHRSGGSCKPGAPAVMPDGLVALLGADIDDCGFDRERIRDNVVRLVQ